MSTSTDTDEMIFIELVGEHEIPCELGKTFSGCDRTAEWAMFRKSGLCDCGSRPPALACTDCKDMRMARDEGVVCAECGVLVAPARKAYSRIEAL